MTSVPASTSHQLSDKLQRALESDGFAAAEALIREHEASLWFNLATTFEARDRDRAWECAQRAFTAAPRKAKRPYARRLFDLGNRIGIRTYPAEVFKLLSTSPYPDEAARFSRLLERSAAWNTLAAHGFPMPQRSKQRAYLPIPGKVLIYLDHPLSTEDRSRPDYPGLLTSLDRFGVAVATDVSKGMTPESRDPETDIRAVMDDLETVVRRERPEVIHAGSSYLAGLPAVVVGRRLGVPVIVHLQQLATELATNDPDWYLSSAYDAAIKLETIVGSTVDALVCPSESLKMDLIARGANPDTITIVSPTIPMPRFEAGTQHHVQRPLGVIVFGSGDSRQTDVLQVASIMIDQGRDLRVFLIGETAITDQTHQAIADLELGDDVRYLESLTRPDIDRLARDVDLIAVPSLSWFETNTEDPSPLLALMARAIPIVVTGGKGPAEILPSEENGVVSASATIDGLLKALDRVTGDSAFRARLGANARAWVFANRSTEQAATTLRSLYRSLATGERLPQLIRPDRHDERLWWKLMKPLERKRQAGILDYSWRGTVLDLGTRNGIIAAYVALTQAPDVIVGIDPDMAALDDARQIVSTNQITTSRLEFVAAIGESLPFANGSFDGVIVTQVLEHVEYPERVLQEIVRVLRPNGSVLIGVPGYGEMPPGTTIGHVQDFTIAEMTELIEASGLDLVEQRTVDVREYYFARLPDAGRSG